MISKKPLLAAAITGLMAAGSLGLATSVQADSHEGECHGVNACKTQGDCGAKASKGAQGHSCAGKNACKGKGWVMMSEKDCKAKKGKWHKHEGHADSEKHS